MKHYNIKIPKTEENERMIEYIKKEMNIKTVTTLVNVAIGQMYLKMTKYKPQKYIKGVLQGNPVGRPPKERLQGSVLGVEEQTALCLRLPNGSVNGEVCEYSTYNEVTGKEYRIKRPLSALSENFVEEVNTDA